MIVYTIKKFTQNDTIQLTSTVWELSRNKEFTDIIETKTLTPPNNLEVYISNIEVPPNTKYYLRVTRKFANNPQADHSLPIKEVQDYKAYLNNLILPDNINIDTPVIYINEEDFKDNDMIDFEIKTSMFRSKEDGHSSTHWIITTQDGDILFSSLYDKLNKTSIRITKSQDILNRTKIKIYAIHVGTNGMESKPGIATLVNNEFAFDINGVRTNLLPYTDATFTISPSGGRNSIISVYLIDQASTGSDIKGINITPSKDSNEIVIPGQLLNNYGSKYYLDIYCYSIYGEYLVRRYPVTVRESTEQTTITDYTYNLKIDTMDNNLSNLNIPTGFTTHELINGNVLLPKRGSTKLTKFKIKTSSTVDGTKVQLDLGTDGNGYGERDDIALSSNTVDNILIKFLNNKLLLIDNYNSSNKPTFLLYTYNEVTDRFTFLQQLERPNETICLGNSNSIIHINNDELWYMAILTSKLMSYNIKTNTVKELLDLGDANFQKACMFFNRRLNRLFLYDGNCNGNILDTETLSLVETSNFQFEDWKNNLIKPVELSNGDYLMFNTNPNTATPVAYYYSTEHKLKAIPTTVSANSVFTGSINTLYNNVVFLTHVNNQGTVDRTYTSRRFY